MRTLRHQPDWKLIINKFREEEAPRKPKLHICTRCKRKIKHIVNPLNKGTYCDHCYKIKLLERNSKLLDD